MTTWKTPTGWIVVRDALTMGPLRSRGPVTPHTRPPADDDADHMLVRIVECLEGHVEVDLVCEPAFDYGRTPAEWTHHRRRSGTPRTRSGPTVRSAWCRTSRSAWRAGACAAGTSCEAGERAFCALSWAEDLDGARRTSTPPTARIDATRRFWRNWLGRARIPDHRWRDPMQRSALAIKGLTYMPTGATIAALTTSLPETPGGERNWDYRYTWMRDTTFTLQALHWLNLDWEADEFMQFVADLEPNADGSLQIMYGIDGRRDLTESTPRRPLGLRRGAPGPHRQRRVRPAPERRLRRRARLDPAAHEAQPAAAAPAVADRAGAGGVRHRASGESRTRASGRRAARRSTTSPRSSCAGWRSTAPRSSPTCAATPRSASSGARSRRRSAPTSWSTACAADGVLRQHYETDALDASALLAAIFGFLPGTDERLRATVDAIQRELTADGFVLRYRTEETDDGL